MKRLLCLLILSLVVAPPVLGDARVASSCIARVVYEGNLNEQFLEDLVNQPGLAGEITRDMFDMSFEEFGGGVAFDRTHSDMSGSYFRVALRLPVDAPITTEQADAFLDAALKRLDDALDGNFQRMARRQQVQIEEVNSRMLRLEEQIKELEAQKSALAKQADGELMTYEQALDAQRRAAEHLREIKTQTIVVTETRDALAGRIAEIAEQARDRAESDEVLGQLRELMALRESSLGQVERMVESGHASEAELNKAREAMIETRIEIARRREALGRDQTGERLARLNAQLDDLLIEAARLEAMYHMAELRYNEMHEKDLVSIAEHLQRIDRDMDTAREDLHIQRKMLQSYRMDMARIKAPSVEAVE